MGDRIDPIRPRPPTAAHVGPIRPSDGSAEKRERDSAEPRKRRPPPPAGPPAPDDGLPHIDVRV
ncbi:MAG: hypothetical protein JWQ20_1671 [Conexibacter sp.]|nr:hypothetical protein [Conexibacter sp.]